MDNTVEGSQSRATEAEAGKNDLLDRMVGINATKQNERKRMKRNEDSLRDLWDSIKHTSILIMVVAEGEEREEGPEKISKVITAEKFPSTGQEIINQIQEAQSPRQDKLEEEHIETQSDETDRN